VPRVLATIGLAALVVIAALMLVPPLLGYERYVIEGGSMGGALPRGSIAYEEVVPTARIQVGDVITYRPPGAARLITHRVVSIGRGRVFRTKGDANAAIDSWEFTLPSRTQARMVLCVPLAGYVLEALAVRPLRMAVIGGPALAIALAALGSAVQRGRTPIFG
jgi:signal peptidase